MRSVQDLMIGKDDCWNTASSSNPLKRKNTSPLDLSKQLACHSIDDQLHFIDLILITESNPALLIESLYPSKVKSHSHVLTHIAHLVTSLTLQFVAFLQIKIRPYRFFTSYKKRLNLLHLNVMSSSFLINLLLSVID
ncbi:hypothetical protein KEM48_013785 [Puccinia striiformis f. sp. tritici PST-130]|nr:hypothetical protein KEM48_013785 [Puccinia striiformis f. sp. tritici PST-130]